MTKWNEAWLKIPLASYLTSEIDLHYYICLVGIPALLLIFQTLWVGKCLETIVEPLPSCPYLKGSICGVK